MSKVRRLQHDLRSLQKMEDRASELAANWEDIDMCYASDFEELANHLMQFRRNWRRYLLDEKELARND